MPDQIDPYRTIGTTGLALSGGRVYEEFHKRLQGDQAHRVYREMAKNSSVVGSILFAIKNLIVQTSWRIEPADESPEALDAAEFVESCMEDMSHTWEDFLRTALSFLPYGWSLFEVVFKVRGGPSSDRTRNSKHQDNRIGWRKLSARSQETLYEWIYDEHNELTAMDQSDTWSSNGVVRIPLNKAIHFVLTEDKENPEGQSVLRNAVVDYWFVKRENELEAIGIERDLAGLPTMEVPVSLLSQNASAGDKAILASLQTMLAQVRRDERAYAIVPAEVDREGKPTGYKFKLLSSGGGHQIDAGASITRHEQRIAMSVLAQFVFLGMQQVGSFSLASSQTSVFATALGAIMDLIAATFNAQAIRPLIEINHMDPELCPKLVHGDVEQPDLAALSSFVTSLAGAGVLGSGSELERKLLEMAGLPVPDAEPDMPLPSAPTETPTAEG